jgi:hypothetical protein
MTQYSSPRRRALIVEDEVLIAFDLEATMSALGFVSGRILSPL